MTGPAVAAGVGPAAPGLGLGGQTRPARQVRSSQRLCRLPAGGGPAPLSHTNDGTEIRRFSMICNLCPRSCNALRTETQGQGFWRMPATPVAARPPSTSGRSRPSRAPGGSGAIFFSGCPLRCVFCQNEAISHNRFGTPLTAGQIRDLCLDLIAQGAHNINLVSPTHYAHILGEVLAEPLPVPVVWNTGGYEKTETLAALEGKVDVYLPDLKYLDGAVAARYSRRARLPPGGHRRPSGRWSARWGRSSWMGTVSCKRELSSVISCCRGSCPGPGP